MENNSRGNTKVQNTMHELSYGRNTQKTRLNPIYGIVFPFLALVIFQSLHSSLILRLTLTLGLGIMFHLLSEPKQIIERKTETEITPTYSLKRTDLLCMLRNAQVERRGK